MGGPVSLIDAQASRVLGQLKAVAGYFFNHLTGGQVTDGGSSQASGANTPPTLDIDTDLILDATVQGTPVELAAQAGLATVLGDGLVWGATSGKSAIVAAVLDNVPSIKLVAAAPADTGEQVAPTDEEISAALGHDNWVRSAHIDIERTADTAITLTITHAGVRPAVTEFSGASLAVTNAEFTSGGFERIFPTTPSTPPS